MPVSPLIYDRGLAAGLLAMGKTWKSIFLLLFDMAIVPYILSFIIPSSLQISISEAVQRPK